MRALLLFSIAFSSGICCILADKEEKKVHWTEITKNPSASIADSNSFNSADFDTIYKQDRFNVSKRNKNTKQLYDDFISEQEEKFKEREENNKQYVIGKILFIVIRVVAVGLITGGVCACIRCVCRKKNREVATNADETFTALAPDTNTTGSQPPVLYPLSQMPNSSAPYVYFPLQKNPPYPSAPYPSTS